MWILWSGDGLISVSSFRSSRLSFGSDFKVCGREGVALCDSEIDGISVGVTADTFLSITHPLLLVPWDDESPVGGSLEVHACSCFCDVACGVIAAPLVTGWFSSAVDLFVFDSLLTTVMLYGWGLFRTAWAAFNGTLHLSEHKCKKKQLTRKQIQMLHYTFPIMIHQHTNHK